MVAHEYISLFKIAYKRTVAKILSIAKFIVLIQLDTNFGSNGERYQASFLSFDCTLNGPNGDNEQGD